MTSLRFVKLSPTKNITVLIRDAVPRALQSAIAGKLMACDGIGAEQVGFVESPENPAAMARLQMMGGEFCGNATISLAAVLARDTGIPGGSFLLEVSGCDSLVSCHLESAEAGFTGTVSMPLPEGIGSTEGYPAVFFPGIAHIIAPAGDFPEKAEAEAFIRRAAQSLNAGGAGLMLLDGDAMTPCVYVRETDSVVWERSCASGTAAMGVYFALENGLGTVSLRQPGGVMTARAVCEQGQITSLTVSGGVRIVAEGTAFVTI